MKDKMRYSEVFTKTIKDAPAEETAKNAQLLIKAGYIYKDMAGVYAFLPLGLKIIENIKKIVREEMNSLGGQELIMTSLQNKATWEQTDRWNDKNVDIWFKTKLQNGTELGLAWSHEEQITTMMKQYLSSHRDLPVYVYQFQNKLRNELRAKSGIMRCREFLMKDLYSYSLDEKQHQKFYDDTIEAYHRIYKRVGVGDSTYFTFASGGAFTQFSHEFQTVCDAGEDTIYIDKNKKLAINEEVLNDEVLKQLGVNKSNLEEHKAAEVGNIFSFGTTKSEQIGLYYNDQDGSQKPVVLGSYGIGITRLMGVIVEKFADSNGLIWPENIAPYQVYLAVLGTNEKASKTAEKLYDELQKAGVEVLFDDRDVRPGEKFADADLIGIPNRVVVSEKSLAGGGVEFKKRTSDKTEIVTSEQLQKQLAN